MLWLQKANGDKAFHDQLKIDLSGPEYQQERDVARTVFRELAAAKGGVYQDVLDEELAQYGSAEEPVALPVSGLRLFAT